jgi:hypothetical protein
MPGFVDTEMTKGVDAPKLSAGAVAAAVVEALRSSVEDVYPGEAADIPATLQRDPKAVEKRLAAL